ncbi:hypothetical protein COY95_02965 [Candidatus Woesearchaeota archaeon CG_4_10_14_0_8_um_filter_47_5]|nr:MAG: hypothetical protein COY95_02965 [Candidatus Woesearchaeota archaeon CG_4_10_14_0_8_um_filter_47_5]
MIRLLSSKKGLFGPSVKERHLLHRMMSGHFSFRSFFRGIILGLIIGAVVMYLFLSGRIHLPFSLPVP